MNISSLERDILDKTIKDFSYGPEHFNFKAREKERSPFDLQLERLWKQRMDDGCFRYKLGNLQTKYLDGKYKFIAQLNVKRAIERRKPQEISNIVMPFNNESFHFGKVPDHELLFKIEGLHWGELKPGSMEKYKHALIINVSPLEFCHSLLIPSIEKCLPQVLNFDALRVAVELMLVSYNNQLRMGYNSLGALASVNHLHFHIYHLAHTLFLENAPVSKLEGLCYELNSFPAEGFAFEISGTEDILDVLGCVMLLIDHLMKKKIPHNVFLTRGTAFKSMDTIQNSSIRIYVWAREAWYGTKVEAKSFNVAVCELSGHLPIKTEESFLSITESEVAKCLKNACYRVFHSIREEVKSLLQTS